jgi:hypothetical protein
MTKEEKKRFALEMRKIRLRLGVPMVKAFGTSEEIARQANHTSQIEGIDMSMDRLIKIAQAKE